MSSATPAKRTTAAKKTTTTTATVAAPAPTPVVAAPAVVATPVATTVATPAAAPVAAPVDVAAEFSSFVDQVENVFTAIGGLRSFAKKFQKQLGRALKNASKGRRRRTAPVEGGVAVPKKESVFTKATPISDGLCTFLGVAKGSLLSRSEVTKRICTYAKDKKLMEKQVIKADAPLRKLLALTEKDELKILNLQFYLKPHYLKPAAPVATA